MDFRRHAVAAIGLVLLLPGTALSFSSPEELIASYVAAIEAGDWTGAEAMWTPADREAAQRLGIAYAGIPLKIDCASPLLLERGRWTAGSVQVEVESVSAPSARIAVRLGPAAGDATARYHARLSDGQWSLVAATTAQAADWDRIETGFLEIRTNDPSRLSDPALRLLDEFTREACRRLGVSDDRIEHLRRHKLGYYLCDEATVAALAGAPTRGVALLPIDAVVTSEPCHLHELAHLIVNYALRDAPLYTLPALQEGAAVALGGRWGRSPLAMQGLGRFSLDGGLVTLDELLPLESFRALGADWTYAPSGVLVSYLLDALGGERFLGLYRRLSGDYDELARLTGGMIRERLCEGAGRDWPTLEKELGQYVAALSCGGFTPTDGATGEVVLRASAGDGEVIARCDDVWWTWTVRGWDGRSRCAVLLHAPDGGAAAAGSRLFAEQFGDRPYAGESCALVLAPGEIGLYDFGVDLLQAKYVEGFCADRPFTPAEGGSVSFRMPRSLVPAGAGQPVLVMDVP